MFYLMETQVVNSFVQNNMNKRLLSDGLALLAALPDESVKASFFDPQYRPNLDYLKFGNEGKSRMKKRSELPQMGDDVISMFLNEQSRVLVPSGYLFFWVDKFILAEGIHQKWFSRNSISTGSGSSEKITFLEHMSSMKLVDLIIWGKGGIGMGARTRRKFEALIIYQKTPRLAKVTWLDKGIPDFIEEKIPNPRTGHAHKKPIGLTSRLIESVTKKGDLILDPCSGSFSTMDACLTTGRNFIGCDISADYGKEAVIYEKS